MANKRHWVKIGGAIGDVGESKFGFQAPEDAYNGIADELGVTVINDANDARGILFGANYPRPPRVRISGNDGVNGNLKRSVTRFCDPDKLGSVLNGALIGKTVNAGGNTFVADSCTIAG